MAAGIAWTYVALIGFPAAACRAAVILAVVAVSGLRGRPPTRWGALSAAGLLLLAIDPRMLASPGFQLSFAGAGGLVAWSGALETVLRRALRIRRPQALLAGLAAGIAATVATLPIVAWHFERVSLVGIPMTLAATPLVSLALPGVLASLALDFGSPSAAGFLAGGVSALLDMLVRLADLATDRPWASVAVSRATVAATLLGVALATAVATHSRIHGRTRRTLVALYVSGSVCAWPLAMSLEGRGSLEVFMVDVGQGDAIAIRTPGGRWVLVDAGPEGNAGRRVGGQASGTRPRGGAGGRLHPVVAALRARGVRRIEMLVLTHPDLDHFGGGAAVLNAFEVGRVIDPALPAPKESYLRLLEEARRHGVPWNAAVAGQDFVVDDVRFRILHPDVEAVAEGEANQASVVLHVTWRDFDAVLTGDAYVDVERALIGVLPDVDLLKVGHHGSTTSTDSLFLVATRPEISLLSVGRRNGYGHPAPVVLGRLERVGSRVYRTDQDGDVRVLVRRDGAVRVMTSRER